MNQLDRYLSAGLIVFFAVGVVGHMNAALRPMMTRLTPVALLLTAGVVAVPVVRERNARVAIWAIAACVVGFALEVVGVATGALFGRYGYGDLLGPRLAGVPLIIGANWGVVSLGSASLASRVFRNPFATAALAGAVAAGFDWVLEPFAVSSGYWAWSGGSIPLRNFLVWFLVVAAFTFVYARGRPRLESWVASFAVLIQLTFFAALRAGGA